MRDSLLFSSLTPTMDAYSAQLPFELVEIVISEFWYSEHDSDVRIAFMIGFPLVCSLWRDVYANITSRDIYVPTLRYLFYLSSIIRSKKSSIYRPFLRESTSTITCHVNAIDSNNDSALFPYVAFCHMPNYVGFRKCFPNIQSIHLQIKLIPGIDRPRGLNDQIIRTQVSIRLDQAWTKTGLSVLPVDWYISIIDPPDIDEVDPGELGETWTSLLSALSRDMHQSNWKKVSINNNRSHSSAAKGSTCSDGARHFHYRKYTKEQFQDLWGINHRFWKAARPPVTQSERHISFEFLCSLRLDARIFFDLIRDLFWLNCADAQLPMWTDRCYSRGFQGTAMWGRYFTVKHGTVVEVLNHRFL
ncbi:hypothetical protein IW261DRAFT_693007 [Armillaria novae-zelandiae]|uniref:Uncharacterized protein n=1 Tax=Armillaria novae-zelandiae TaxID=153914 RepID=A0AA39NX04_9AGAR|nr:hypothetical protein IW261DRAFT_693007 [Armillaria novae-zelandiae]